MSASQGALRREIRFGSPRVPNREIPASLYSWGWEQRDVEVNLPLQLLAKKNIFVVGDERAPLFLGDDRVDLLGEHPLHSCDLQVTETGVEVYSWEEVLQ